MSLEELRAFLAVAEHQSFVGAATAMGVARTSLRRHVDALEARTGVPLLERGHAGVVLTEAGRQLLERGRSLDREFTALLGAVRETGTAPSGPIRALLPVGLPAFIVTAVIGIIRSAWPGMRLTFRFAEAPLAAPLVDVDLIVWFGLDAPPGAWTCHTVAPAPLRLLASPSYLANRGRPTSVAALADHDVYAWLAPGDREPALISRRGERVPATCVLATSHIDVLHTCARRGLGLAWTPDGQLPALDGETLVPVLDGDLGAPCELRIAAPAALASVPRVQAVLSNLALIRSAGAKPP